MRLLPHVVKPVANPEYHRHPVALHERLEEVHERGIGVLDRPLERVLLLLGGEVRGEEESRQVAVLVERIGELAELLAHLVEHLPLGGDLEQRAGVDLGDLLHQERSPTSYCSPGSAC